VPREDVTFLKMSVEDAAKIIISAGMVVPDYQARLKQLAERARAGAAKTLAQAPQPPRPDERPPPPTTAEPHAARKRRTASSHSKR
jgi:hypothetical protein